MLIDRGCDASTFNQLRTLDVARQSLDVYRDRLAEIGAVLARHGVHDVVGLSLAHRHFAIERGELLVDRIDRVSGVSTTKPERVGQLSDLVPHTFHLLEVEGRLRWVATEWCAADEVLREALSRLLTSGAMDEVAQELQRIGAHRTFGLCVFHGREELLRGVDQVLVEASDDATRTSTITAKAASEVPWAETVDTIWLYDGKTCRMACTCQGGSDHRHFETN